MYMKIKKLPRKNYKTHREPRAKMSSNFKFLHNIPKSLHRFPLKPLFPSNLTSSQDNIIAQIYTM